MNTENDTSEVNSLENYLHEIFHLSRGNNFPIFFRGQACDRWSVKPSIMRSGLKEDAENKAFSELMTETPDEFYNDKYMFDKLVRAQHYGLPTRILDVTLNPLVALYFACHDENYYQTNGAVFAFEVTDNHRLKYPDSDTISLITYLTRLSDRDRSIIVSTYNNGNHQLHSFVELEPILRLIHFVKTEKPYFKNNIDPIDLFRYYFVYPNKNNKRVIAQSGAFMVTGLLDSLPPNCSDGIEVSKIVISAGAKENLLTELNQLNINSRTLFPEIEYAAKYIRQKWTNNLSIKPDSCYSCRNADCTNIITK